MITLNRRARDIFTRKYLPIWIGDIKKVTLLRYKKIEEYMVNEHYLVILKGKRVIEKDLQE